MVSGGHNKKPKEVIVCGYCGIEKLVQPCFVGRKKYCSLSCLRAAKKRKPHKCKTCAKEFTTKGIHFCSVKCYSETRKVVDKANDIKKVCEVCKTSFTGSKHDHRKGMARFCSKKCFGVYKSHNAHIGYSRGNGGQRKDLGGKYFRSSWEANYARYLNTLVESKQIKSWEYETETFWFEAIKRGTRFYTPDFIVTTLCGVKEYHEIKGYMDKKSATKLKRMRIYHPGISVKVIGSKEYKELERTVGGDIKGWEFKRKS